MDKSVGLLHRLVVECSIHGTGNPSAYILTKYQIEAQSALDLNPYPGEHSLELGGFLHIY